MAVRAPGKSPRALNFVPNSAVVAPCRPGDPALTTTPAANAFTARFDRAVMTGRFLNVDAILFGGTTRKVRIPRDSAARPEKGRTIRLRPDPSRLRGFPAPPAGREP